MRPRSFVMPRTAKGSEVHRVILLCCAAAALGFAALQTSYRLWLLQTGVPIVGEVVVAQDSCVTRHRANCFMGRAVVNPRMKNHIFKTTKIPGGRFYDEGELLPMRVYPSERWLYLAAVYTPTNWLLGPVRAVVVALLLLLAAAQPGQRVWRWLLPIFLAMSLTLG